MDEDGRDEDDEAFPGVSELLGTFFSEPSLWPVLLVALGSGGAFGAALLILAVVDRNPFAMAALVLVLGMTVDVVVRSRRHPEFRNGARLIGLLWFASIAMTALAVATGIASS